MRLGENPVLQL